MQVANGFKPEFYGSEPKSSVDSFMLFRAALVTKPHPICYLLIHHDFSRDIAICAVSSCTEDLCRI